VRVDLVNGEVAGEVKVPRGEAASPGDRSPLTTALRSVAAWIAPSVAGKILLEPALAISPDGSRLYAVAERRPDVTSASQGSAWIFVFDARTLTLLARWEATADIDSIALSEDGRFVLAAGMPRYENSDLEAEASVTAHDARTGEVRFIAGRLGEQPIMFDPTLLGE
jgi:hypothetical protein